MNSAILVFLGGGIGSLLRYLVVLGCTRAGLGKSFPWSIMLANLTGSFALGYLAGLPMIQRGGKVWSFLVTGILGGYTTFSTLANDSWELLADGRPGAAAGNLFGSAVLGLACAAAGFFCARAVHA